MVDKGVITELLSPGAVAPELSPRTSVLLLEPDPYARGALSVALGAAGFGVLAAETARQAFRLCASGVRSARVLLCAAELGHDDGVGVASELRVRAGAESVLLLSRQATVAVEQCAASGADDCLLKPVFAQDVVALVRLALAAPDPEGWLTCRARELSFARVLRALLSGVRSGRLELEGGRGHLRFRRGAVHEATFGGVVGAVAVEKMLKLATDRFRVIFGPVLGGPLGPTYALKELVSRGFPALLRFQSELARGLPLDSVLALHLPRLMARLPTLPREVVGLARLFDGRRTVRDAMIATSLPEDLCLEVILRLVSDGVLGSLTEQVVSSSRAAGARAPAGALQMPTASLAPRSRPRSDTLPLALALESAVSARAVDTVEDDFFAAAEELATEPATAPAPELAGRGAWRGWGRAGLGGLAVVALLGAIVMSLGRGPTVGRGPTAASTPAPLPPPSAPEPPAVVLPAATPTLPEAIASSLPAALEEPSTTREELSTTPDELSTARRLYRAGAFAEAAARLERVVTRAPRLAEGWVALGLARFDLGDSEGASTAALTALEIEPRSGEARLLLASIHLAEGRPELARAELHRYLADEPSGLHAAEARALLARVR